MKSKTELKKECSRLLYVDKLTREDKKFLWNIFKNHPNFKTKVGIGVKDISIMENKFNKCFQLIRKDGTTTDISFLACFENPKNQKLKKIKRACREACSQIIIDFRNNIKFGLERCAISGEVLQNDNTDIDHYDLTFDELVNLWIKNKDIEYIYSNITGSEDNQIGENFIDEDIKADFIRFHNKNTNLRAVTKKINRSLLKKLQKSQNKADIF